MLGCIADYNFANSSLLLLCAYSWASFYSSNICHRSTDWHIWYQKPDNIIMGSAPATFPPQWSCFALGWTWFLLHYIQGLGLGDTYWIVSVDSRGATTRCLIFCASRLEMKNFSNQSETKVWTSTRWFLWKFIQEASNLNLLHILHGQILSFLIGHDLSVPCR